MIPSSTCHLTGQPKGGCRHCVQERMHAAAARRMPSPDLGGATPMHPHQHGKPTDTRVKQADPRVVVDGPWPDCEFCLISGHHVPAAVRGYVGTGHDRNLCERCATALAHTTRPLIRTVIQKAPLRDTLSRRGVIQ